jgi:hypothetical protein
MQNFLYISNVSKPRLLALTLKDHLHNCTIEVLTLPGPLSIAEQASLSTRRFDAFPVIPVICRRACDGVEYGRNRSRWAATNQAVWQCIQEAFEMERNNFQPVMRAEVFQDLDGGDEATTRSRLSILVR